LFVTYVLPFGGNFDNLINTIRVKSKIFEMAATKNDKKIGFTSSYESTECFTDLDQPMLLER